MKVSCLIVLVASAICSTAGANEADPYPTKPVRIVVPFSAGSASDSAARILADEVRKRLGATVVVDNRPGASGIIGASHVAKAAPDGYTLILTSSSTHSAISALFRSPGYDPLKDFVHISRIATIPMLMVARPDAPFKTLAELVATSKTTRLRYGYGSGSSQIAAATFSTVADVAADAIPYKSQPPAVTDLLGSQIDYMFADMSVVSNFLKAGRLQGLAITTAQRSADLPQLPTLAESGFSNFDLVVWVGLAAPANTPPAIVNRWNKELTAALAQPNVVAQFERLGMAVSPNSPQQHAQFTREQATIWTNRAKSARVEQQ
jgi:tripartite-type tricarboxylate transporter receptor subunit TctC